MVFKLVHAKYDRETERAYVELRDDDKDGGEALVVAIFSYRTTSRVSKAQIEQDIVRKARRHVAWGQEVLDRLCQTEGERERRRRRAEEIRARLLACGGVTGELSQEA